MCVHIQAVRFSFKLHWGLQAVGFNRTLNEGKNSWMKVKSRFKMVWKGLGSFFSHPSFLSVVGNCHNLAISTTCCTIWFAFLFRVTRFFHQVVYHTYCLDQYTFSHSLLNCNTVTSGLQNSRTGIPNIVCDPNPRLTYIQVSLCPRTSPTKYAQTRTTRDSPYGGEYLEKLGHK